MAGNRNSGRRPKPTALRLIEGTLSPNGKAKNGKKPKPDKVQPAVASNVPKPPTHWAKLAKGNPTTDPNTNVDPITMYAYATEYWKDKAAVLHPLGLLTSADLTHFEMCAVAYGRWRHAMDECDKGMYVADPEKPPTVPGGPWGAMKNPYFGLVDKFQKSLARMEIEFGMTPASRSKVDPSKSPPAQPPGAGETPQLPATGKMGPYILRGFPR